MIHIKPDVEEALRYLGAGEQAPEGLRRDVSAVAQELAAAVQPRYVYKCFKLIHSEDQVIFSGGGITMSGKTVMRMLAQCSQAVLMACTLGPRFEGLLRAEQARDMSKAVILDACGSALVESGCDEVERIISQRFPGYYLTDRFSPGYGDLPLEHQPSICAILDAQRRLGIYVTSSLLMNPSKSVTAVIGLSDRPQMARIRGCGYCSMRETCLLRKGGKSCAV